MGYKDHNDYVNFNQASKLEKLGFDWNCNTAYFEEDQAFSVHPASFDFNHVKGYGQISAPTLALAQKWLRENKETDLMIVMGFDRSPSYYWYILSKDNFLEGLESTETFDSYEEALSDGLDTVLNYL